MFLCSSLSLGPKNEISNLAPFSQFEERLAALRSQLLAAGYKDPTELRRALTKENYLGRSLFTRAYLIPGLDEYVLKVPFFSSGKPIFWDEIKILSDPFPDMNLGQAIAQVGKKAFILKRQYGVPTGVSYMDNKKVKAHYTAQLERAARMPQSAYNQFANIIIEINSRGYYFDSNPGNVLIDEEQLAFNVIDVMNDKRKNTLEDMITSLQTYFVWNYRNSEDVEYLRSLASQIILKSIEAARITGLAVPDSDDSRMRIELGHVGWKWPPYRELILSSREPIIALRSAEVIAYSL